MNHKIVEYCAKSGMSNASNASWHPRIFPKPLAINERKMQKFLASPDGDAMLASAMKASPLTYQIPARLSHCIQFKTFSGQTTCLVNSGEEQTHRINHNPTSFPPARRSNQEKVASLVGGCYLTNLAEGRNGVI